MVGQAFDLDSVIERLLQRHGMPRQGHCPDGEPRSQMTGFAFPLLEAEVLELVRRGVEVLEQQPSLLQLAGPFHICGDMYGQYVHLLEIFDRCGHPPQVNYLFLGNYVDQGKRSLETLCLLIAYAVKHRDHVFLLRGNHECGAINRIFGFFDECKERLSFKAWRAFLEFFDWLPLAAVLEGRIFCVHGGLSPALKSLEQIAKVQRPCDIPDAGLICDLLWSDPDPDLDTWEENDRGVSYAWGWKPIERFFGKTSIELIVRSHQVVEEGYELLFGKRVITIFSARNYGNEYDNAGAVLRVDQRLVCSFETFASEMECGGVLDPVPVEDDDANMQNLQT